MGNTIFVYGTLMFPEVRIPMMGIREEGIPAQLHGYERLTVWTRADGKGNFPAVIPHPAKTVTGLLFHGLSDKALAQLDWFEQIETRHYERKLLPIEHAGGSENAWVYVCGPALLPLLKGGWDPDEFARRELAEFVATTVGVSTHAFDAES